MTNPTTEIRSRTHEYSSGNKTEIIPYKIEGSQKERIRKIKEFANREKTDGRILENAFNLEKNFDLRNIKDFLPETYRINQFLNNPFIKFTIILSLLYHIFLYTYLAITKQGGAFYTGIMFSIMYSGALMSYWIIYRQNSTLLNWTNIFSSEVVMAAAKNVKRRKTETKNIMNYNNNQCIINHSTSDNDFKEYLDNYKLYYNPITQFQFMNENTRYLYTRKNAQLSFYNYCYNWEKIYSRIFYALWNIFPIGLIIIKIIPDDIIYLGKSFDDEPIGLWGYYNLTGQSIASIGIITASIIMLSSFNQLRCMILGYVEKIRSYRNPELELNDDHLLPYNRFFTEQKDFDTKLDFKNDTELINYKFTQTREEYLYLQSCSIILSDLWSTPIAVIIFFCTEVVISNIYVINYQLTKCGVHNKNMDVNNSYCDYFVGFSFIWLFAALGYAGLLLYTISSINTASAKIKNAFIYSNEGLTDVSGEKQLVKSDFYWIGGRSRWISYIESNPLNFSAFGITISSKFVVNTTYAAISTLGTFLFSYVFTDDDEE